MLLLPFALLIGSGPIRRHGPCWRICRSQFAWHYRSTWSWFRHAYMRYNINRIAIALKYNCNATVTSKWNCIQRTCNHEWILTLRINHTHLCRPINNFGIYIADRHWCIPHNDHRRHTKHLTQFSPGLLFVLTLKWFRRELWGQYFPVWATLIYLTTLIWAHWKKDVITFARNIL